MAFLPGLGYRTVCFMIAGAAVCFTLTPNSCPGAERVASHESLFRIPIPEKLPDHPRVFCTAADLARVRKQLEAGDPYATECQHVVVAAAVERLNQPGILPRSALTRDHLHAAADLARAYAISENETFGKTARDILVAAAPLYANLPTTRARGRLTENTLTEGPVAVEAAMAYDLIAAAPWVSTGDHEKIRRDLLRRMALECGHKCHHTDSSNWRSWALCILASCGFAAGDRDLIDEAINGLYDQSRGRYLYGIVQQLTHSIFSDGIHWERSIGYTYYTAGALMHVMVAAANSGIDLWHADLPGIPGPFTGSARHEEYGPEGNRSIKAFLDAPFYYAFPDGSFARIGDSGTRSLKYHPIYELAWKEYRDPKYAWLITRQRRANGTERVANWKVWRPKGSPVSALSTRAYDGSNAMRLTASQNERIALVQDVVAPANKTLIVSAWVRLLSGNPSGAHIRCNSGGKAWFTPTPDNKPEWQKVAVKIPPAPNAKPNGRRRVRLHVFREGMAGDVLWDDVKAVVNGDQTNAVRNGSFERRPVNGRKLAFWDLIHGAAEVPAGAYDLSQDGCIGLTGVNRDGSTLFPVGGFAVLRSTPANMDATVVNLSFGPYGSGHDHPDRLTLTVYGLGKILCPDAGSWGYDNPMHLTWANQTIAHNTLTVDQVSQQPQGTSKSIWAAERGSQRVSGTLRFFQSNPNLPAIRVTCDTAYENVTMDRTVALLGDLLVDVFRVTAGAEHTFDLPTHARGTLSCRFPVRKLRAQPFDALGYRHLRNVGSAAPETGFLRAVFSTDDANLLLMQVVPEGTRVFCAEDPEKSGTSVLITRRQGRESLFVTLLEPFRKAPSSAALAAAETPDGIEVTVERNNGTQPQILLFAKDRVSLRD